MSGSDTFKRVKEAGVIPAIRTSSKDDAVKAVEAICQGGIAVIEVSLAMRNSLDVLAALAASYGKTVLVGAGTVVNAESVRQAALAGARFIVTPGVSGEAFDKAKEFGLAIFAGALTPTEVQAASAAGVDAVKLFPCFAAGGPRYLRALRGQYPATEFIASGGVGLENCIDYVRAGACAIGVGSEIADADSMTSGDYGVFRVRAKRFCEAVRDARALLRSTYSDRGD